jgi:branched-chain amino acid transport system substrate-binding protein
MKRMRLLTVLFTVALLAAACGGGDGGGAEPPGGLSGGGGAAPTPEGEEETAAAGEGETLRIGAPIALTGPIAAQAEEMVNGYNLYLQQNDGLLGGVPAEIVLEDTEADPNTVVTKTRKLIEQDEVHMIGGGALAFESLAIIDIADENDIAFVTPMSSADDLTQRDLRPIFARPNMTSSQPNLWFGEYVANEMGFDRVAIIAQDYAYGWESAGGFQYGFETSGGDIVQKVWVPLDATDLAPFVRQLQTDGVDAIYAMLVGAHVPRFVQAYNDFGLADRLPLIGGPDMADEDALRAMGEEEVGLITVHEYAASLPEAEEFVTAYEEEFGAIPSYWAEGPYNTMAWVDAALTALIDDGTTTVEEAPQWVRDNPEEFITAFTEASIESPHGPLTLDEYHNVVTDLHIFEVTAPDTKEVLATIEDASQFWTVPPEEFLQNPVFSRDFPPDDWNPPAG